MHFHLFRYVEYVFINAKIQSLSSKVKGRVKVKGVQGQGQSRTCDLEMNLVMDHKFDLWVTFSLDLKL